MQGVPYSDSGGQVRTVWRFSGMEHADDLPAKLCESGRTSTLTVDTKVG